MSGNPRGSADRDPWAVADLTPDDGYLGGLPRRDDTWHAGVVRGPARVALLCVLCLVALAVANLAWLVLYVAATALRVAPSGGAGDVSEQVAGGIPIMVLAWLVAVVPVALVGWPAGLALAWALRRRAREAEHVVAFAVVGGVLALLLLRPTLAGGWTDTVGGAVFALAEGAVGAGGGRWWAGVVLRRRMRRGELRDRPARVLPQA